MPTYEYECERCGQIFERRQAITAEALVECPACRGPVHRLISGGAGFILKKTSEGGEKENHGGCSLQQTGRTCCGQTQRCDKPRCDE